MKLQLLALLPLFSVGEYLGYCCPLLTPLHSSPFPASLLPAFAQLFAPVRDFGIDPESICFESDRVGFVLYGGSDPGLRLYTLKRVKGKTEKEYSLVIRLNRSYFVNHIVSCIEPDEDSHQLNIKSREAKTIASLCYRLVQEINVLQDQNKTRELFGPSHLKRGPLVMWSIILGEHRENRIDVMIEVPANRTLIWFRSPSRALALAFEPNVPPAIHRNDTRYLYQRERVENFTLVLIEGIKDWIKQLGIFPERQCNQ